MGDENMPHNCDAGNILIVDMKFAFSNRKSQNKITKLQLL
jgi:hypothetical protein